MNILVTVKRLEEEMKAALARIAALEAEKRSLVTPIAVAESIASDIVDPPPKRRGRPPKS